MKNISAVFALTACWGLSMLFCSGCGDSGGGGAWVIDLEILTQDEAGMVGDDRTIGGAASNDGSIVAFSSQASNLVAGDIANTYDIFMRDIVSGTVTCVSIAEGDTVPAGECDNDVSLSAAGDRVVFTTSTALVAADGTADDDVYLYDTSGSTPALSRVSVNTGGGDAGSSSRGASISSDGSAVVFRSYATDLIPGDTNSAEDIFLCDLSGAPTIERVSLADDESEANDRSTGAVVSGDGDVVAFHSEATNLVAGDTNAVYDVFVRIRSTGSTERVSLADGGTQSTGISTSPSISGDGRYVSFKSDATDLIAADTNGSSDIFVYDRTNDTIERVSIASDGTEANDHCDSSRISADGRFVMFSSSATNLVAGDTNGSIDHFLHDRTTGETVRVNLTYLGGQESSAGDSGPEGFSNDGSMILYQTINASVPGDANGEYDIYMRPNPLAP